MRHNLLFESNTKKQLNVLEINSNHQEQLLQIIDTTLLKCYLQVNYKAQQIMKKNISLFFYFTDQ